MSLLTSKRKVSNVSLSQVYVGDVFCGKVSYEIPEKATFPVACGNNVGGTVKIVLDDQALSLCEVQVLGVPSDETPLVNVAPGLVALIVIAGFMTSS